VSEIGLRAQALVASIARRLTQGVFLIVDYGFGSSEFRHPQRSNGTLMCHYRHRAHDDPFFLPGLQDITAHVDFTAMALAAQAAGAEVLGYTTQAHFLISCGLGLMVSGGDPSISLSRLKVTSAVHRLISPAEMGELFKVLAVGKGIEVPLQGFLSARPMAL
jgi:SAM-dependent MidA family methyltransferase